MINSTLNFFDIDMFADNFRNTDISALENFLPTYHTNFRIFRVNISKVAGPCGMRISSFYNFLFWFFWLISLVSEAKLLPLSRGCLIATIICSNASFSYNYFLGNFVIYFLTFIIPKKKRVSSLKDWKRFGTKLTEFINNYLKN